MLPKHILYTVDDSIYNWKVVFIVENATTKLEKNVFVFMKKNYKNMPKTCLQFALYYICVLVSVDVYYFYIIKYL